MAELQLPEASKPEEKPRGRRGHILTAELEDWEEAIVLVYSQGGGTIKSLVKALIRFWGQEKLVKTGKAKSLSLVDTWHLLITDSQEHLLSLYPNARPPASGKGK